MKEKIPEQIGDQVQRVIDRFGHENRNVHIDLREQPNTEVIKFFNSLAETGLVLFHGTNAEERFDSLEARQANDASKESGNKKAVYATTDIVAPLFLALLNKNYLRSKFGKNFITGWGGHQKMIFKFSPNIYEAFKSGDQNIFSDGYIYVLDKSKFVNAEDAGNEWHSEVDQQPLLACRVSKKLANDLFILGETLTEYSTEEIEKINKFNNKNL